jgi:hypothetical protein
MKQLRYSHALAVSLAEALYVWLYRTIRRLAGSGRGWRGLGNRGRRFLIVGAVVLALIVEFIMLWMLGELVELCISLMELWAELAAKHLEITLDTTV